VCSTVGRRRRCRLSGNNSWLRPRGVLPGNCGGLGGIPGAELLNHPEHRHESMLLRMKRCESLGLHPRRPCVDSKEDNHEPVGVEVRGRRWGRTALAMLFVVVIPLSRCGDGTMCRSRVRCRDTRPAGVALMITTTHRTCLCRFKMQERPMAKRRTPTDAWWRAQGDVGS
jgi:hypothetical protein